LWYNQPVTSEEFRQCLAGLGINSDGIQAMLLAYTAKTVQESYEQNREPVPDEEQAEGIARILRARMARYLTEKQKGGMEWEEAKAWLGL
jgi:hypothetical protein